MKFIFTAMVLLWGLRSMATTFYVDLNNPTPAPPYTNWSMASIDIQSAIDAASDGDLILVTNGVYASGGRVAYGTLTNRVVVDKAVSLQSVNGPGTTIIQGYLVPSGSTAYTNNVRCIYMTNNVVLDGFTVTGGATLLTSSGTTSFIKTQLSGGGVYCESTNTILTNCILTGNVCLGNTGGGGAIYQGTLDGCVLSNNTVRAYSVRGVPLITVC